MPEFVNRSLGFEAIQFGADTFRVIEKFVGAYQIRSWKEGDDDVVEYHVRGGVISLRTGEYIAKFNGKFYRIAKDFFEVAFKPGPIQLPKTLTTYDAG